MQQYVSIRGKIIFISDKLLSYIKENNSWVLLDFIQKFRSELKAENVQFKNKDKDFISVVIDYKTEYLIPRGLISEKEFPSFSAVYERGGFDIGICMPSETPSQSGFFL